MVLVCDFFVRDREAVSNQICCIRDATNGKIIAATRFLGQKSFVPADRRDRIYVYPPVVYHCRLILWLLLHPCTEIHYFEEEPSRHKRFYFNLFNRPLFISMYRQPDEKYARHLKKYRNVKRVFVEMEDQREFLIRRGIAPSLVEVTPTPINLILPKKITSCQYNPDAPSIGFASWNQKYPDALKNRGLIYLLDLLVLTTKAKLHIALRDSKTRELIREVEKRGISHRVFLHDISTREEVLEMMTGCDFIAYVAQSKVVKSVPNSIIEGLALGKPAIISDMVDFSCEVAENNLGTVVLAGQKPKRFYVQLADYKSMSRSGKKYAANHTRENYVNAIMRGYR